MTQLLAHLHPVLVHLPIGMLLLAAVFDFLSRQSKYIGLQAAMPVIYRLGAVSAVLACGSGWLLGRSGTYDADSLQWHQWLGVATASLSIVAAIRPRIPGLAYGLAVLLIATGHFGGSMTHGAGYLNASAKPAGRVLTRPASIPDAFAYEDIIAVILQEKCVSCHSAAKQKGGLRLDAPEALLRGGKGGDVLRPGVDGVGELLRRCLLPPGNDDHMPPRDKPQLTAEELELLRWWMQQGADFTKQVKDLPHTTNILKTLEKWRSGAVPEVVVSSIPTGNPPAAPDARVLAALQRAGVLVLPVSRESQWLSVQCPNLPAPPDSVFALLGKITPQIIWLNLRGVSVPDSAWPIIGSMPQLTRLSLDHSSANDAAMEHLRPLQHLQTLNLSHTNVTQNGLQALTQLPALSRLYVYQSAALQAGFIDFAQMFPKTRVDTGGYQLPFLVSDTARLKQAPSY
jgi:uncharacterized membrane protein